MRSNGIVVIVFEIIDGVGDIERVVETLLMGDLDHIFGQVEAGGVIDHVFQCAAGQPRAAAQIEHAVETGFTKLDQPLSEQQRHMIAEILNQYLVEHFGMLVEQGGDIGFGRAGGHLAAFHRGQPHRSTAVIIGIKRQDFRVGGCRQIKITGFLQRKRAVVGFRQCVIVGLGHREAPNLVSRSFYTKARARQAAIGRSYRLRWRVSRCSIFSQMLRRVSTMTR
jgi:hypothetical protein